MRACAVASYLPCYRTPLEMLTHIRTLMKLCKMNDFSWMYEVGYSNFLAKHIFYTTYVGASEHYIGYHVLDSNSDNATASVAINFEPHIGLCLGYQF